GTLQFVQGTGGWVGVNTSLSNGLVWEAFEARRIAHWLEFCGGQRECKISKATRLDMVFWRPPTQLAKWAPAALKESKFYFVEVKNVTLAKQGCAQFPDAVTERGQRHLVEMMALIDQGHEAELVFTVQRQDCTRFSPAESIDPEYARLLRKAHAAGVRIS